MRKRIPPRPVWPPDLAAYDPAQWVDEFHWHLGRWEWYREHPELADVVDPLGLLRARREARLAAPPRSDSPQNAGHLG